MISSAADLGRVASRLVGIIVPLAMAGCSVQPGEDSRCAFVDCTNRIGPEAAAHEVVARRPDGRPLAVQPGTAADKAVLEQSATEKARQDEVPASDQGRGLDNAIDVKVVAAYVFDGVWKITSPSELSVKEDAPVTYNKVRQVVCRFEQKEGDVAGACVPFRRRMRGKVQGEKLSLDWSSGLVSAEIDGRLQSPVDFKGTISLGLFGVNVPTDMPAFGIKLVQHESPSEAVERTAEAVMTDITANDFPAERYTRTALGKFKSAPPIPGADRKALGQRSSFAYLTQIVIPPASDDEVEKKMSVYDVEFANGWRLCGVVISNDNKVDDVDCR